MLGLRVCATVVLVEVEKGWFGWLSGGGFSRRGKSGRGGGH
jgi:hypothetical protein